MSKHISGLTTPTPKQSHLSIHALYFANRKLPPEIGYTSYNAINATVLLCPHHQTNKCPESELTILPVIFLSFIK